MPSTLTDCAYAAFISYAHADDEAWFNWVTQFRNELERGLAATLRGVKLPPLHLSAENGPVAGVLGEQLEQRIAASFAMIIVVHDNYAQSQWCLKELEYFRQLFGDEGLRERLYIVAMSEPAMIAVAGGSAWQRLMPSGEQLWIGFFDEHARDQPLPVYIGKELVNPEFSVPFLRLRGDLAGKLRKAAASLPAVLASALAAPAEPLPIFAVTAAAAVAPAVAAPAAPAAAAPAPSLLFGFTAPASAAATAAAAQRLRAAGLAVNMLTPDAVFDDFAAFDSAERLVLAFDDLAPMMTTWAAGGHLQVQREAWLRKGRPAERVHWLDLRVAPSAPAAPGGGAAWVAAQGLAAVDAEDLARRLAPAPVAAAPVPGVRIYIESNRNERTLWEPLGDQIRRKWDVLARQIEPARVPPLSLRARGLPVDQLDAYPALDDADGVVLLWGAKTADALIAQINKVENKMAPGRDAAPGIVAYLMPPQQASEPVPAWGWQVLRFNAADRAAIDVVDEERDDLADFLRRVLERRRQRDPAAPP